MKDVEQGLIDWVVVDSQDRFGAKHAYEFGDFVNHLITHGCELWSVAQGLLSDPDNPVTVVMGGIGSITSRKEQKEKARRTLGGHAKKAERGLYQGGPPPFGFDVGIFDHDGTEKWRVIFLGRQRRLKRYQDGTTEEYNGKGNFPSYDPTDEPRWVPTLDESKLRIARRIFEWYADEAISFHRIAQRLNDLKVPCFGAQWRYSTIQAILKNPAYLGIRAWGKTSQAEFCRLDNGKIEEVPWFKNRALVDRKPRPNYIVPAEQYRMEPMISPELWERVQDKLSQRKPRDYHPPRTAALWLKGLLYCGRCDRPMQAWNPKTSRYVAESYLCGTYANCRCPNNPTGCRAHRVRATVIEAILQDFLEKTQRRIFSTLVSPADQAVAGEDDLDQMGRQLMDTFNEMRGFIFTCMQKPKEIVELAKAHRELGILPSPDDFQIRPDIYELPLPDYASGPAWEVFFGQEQAFHRRSLVANYEWLHRLTMQKIRNELAAKELKHEELYESFKLLKSRLAKEKASEEMARLELEIEDARAQLEPLTTRVEMLYKRIQEIGEAVLKAREAMAGDENLRKAEAVRGVVDKIVCHFRHTEAKGNKPQSVLEKVEIFPVEGDMWEHEVSCYGNHGSGARSGRSTAAHGVTRR